jgi:hypothetical protein
VGVVFVADQTEPVRRWAAIKVLQLGMDTKAPQRWFDAETRIFVLLEHPNGAIMLDVCASPEGRPHIIMEFVDGMDIDEFSA